MAYGEKKVKWNGVDPWPLVPYKPEQLCRMQRRTKGVVTAGTVLAWDGAWDHKAVVTYVVYNGTRTTAGGYVYDCYTVGICPLGRFYADGRQEPTPPNKRQSRELNLEVEKGCQLTHGIGKYRFVEPIDAPLMPPLKLRWNKAAKGPKVWPPTEVPDMTVVATSQDEELEHVVEPPYAPFNPIPLDLPEATPEAVLADFLIK